MTVERMRDRRPGMGAAPPRRWGRQPWAAALAVFITTVLITTVAGSTVAHATAAGGVPGVSRSAPSRGASTTDTTYVPPLSGRLRVLRAFEPPPKPYAAGHRGVDLDAVVAAPVLAAGAGQVTFAGQVAGRGLVVIRHADGISTEYEPLAPLVTSGQAVARGQPIGRLSGQHDRWPAGRCLHWGARRGDAYLDPLLLLLALGPVRLLPWPD